MSERRPYIQWTDPAAAEALARLAVDDSPERWQARALCAQADPERWFPEKGGSVREAKAICRLCPVRTECLEYALEHNERFGVWGGLSERERRRLELGQTPRQRLAEQRLIAIEAAGEKSCTKCGLAKPLAEFGRCRGSYQSWCRSCTNEQRRVAA